MQSGKQMFGNAPLVENVLCATDPNEESWKQCTILNSSKKKEKIVKEGNIRLSKILKFYIVF